MTKLLEAGEQAGVEVAYQAFLDLDARVMLPVHWGTFALTDEPVDLPPEELARDLRGALVSITKFTAGATSRSPVTMPMSEHMR